MSPEALPVVERERRPVVGDHGILEPVDVLIGKGNRIRKHNPCDHLGTGLCRGTG